MRWWGHDGWWGTTAYACPELDLTVVAGHQQPYMPKEFDRMAVLADVLELVQARLNGGSTLAVHSAP